MKTSLPPKQEKFCQHYVETGNASQAYRLAYACKNAKDKSIWERASRLLSNSKVHARVEELQEEMRLQSAITKEKILKELSCIAFADIRDFLVLKDGKVEFKNSDKWTDEMAKAVESLKETRDGIELKLNGKSWSIQRICKMLGYDTPTVIDLRNSLVGIDTGIDE